MQPPEHRLPSVALYVGDTHECFYHCLTTARVGSVVVRFGSETDLTTGQAKRCWPASCPATSPARPAVAPRLRNWAGWSRSKPGPKRSPPTQGDRARSSHQMDLHGVGAVVIARVLADPVTSPASPITPFHVLDRHRTARCLHRGVESMTWQGRCAHEDRRSRAGPLPTTAATRRTPRTDATGAALRR
jgi:hypothetical protein